MVGFALFKVLGPKDERPKLAAFSNQWALEDLEWSELFGKQAVSFNLNIVRGEGEVTVTDETLPLFCDAVLKELPKPPSADLTAQDVYRISFNVKNQRAMLYDDDVALTVVDGGCLIDPEAAAAHRYPAPLTDWIWRDDTSSTFSDEEVLEASFVWSGSGDVEVSDFAFEQACTALLVDTPLPLSSRMTKGAVKQIMVWAEKSIGSGQFHADRVTFDIKGDTCLEVAQ